MCSARTKPVWESKAWEEKDRFLEMLTHGLQYQLTFQLQVQQVKVNTKEKEAATVEPVSVCC